MKVLIIDDERNICRMLKEIAEEEGYLAETAITAKDGRDLMDAFNPDMLFLDVKLPDKSGLDLLEELRKSGFTLPVVMISGHGNIPTAVKALKSGAVDFLEKPLSLPLVRLSLQRNLKILNLTQGLKKLQQDAESRYRMVGTSNIMEELVARIEKVAPTNSKVLIRGESGTGKELVAWAIHKKSGRKGNFVRFNSAAIPTELVESELFGHEKGSFTGAISSKKGKIEEADGGTLFLDEIGDMGLSAQAKILRVIQEGEFERVGSNKPIRIETRVVAATHKNLEEMVSKGLFREDLYYRLNVVPLNVPPLRERREDIPVLAQYFSKLYAEEMNVPVKQLSEDVLNKLKNLSFPGNVRQLRNLIERLYIFTEGSIIKPADLTLNPEEMASDNEFWEESISFCDKKHQFEKRYLQHQLNKFKGNITKTAHSLGLQQSNLSRKIRDLNLK
ncbi:MAG: sigma-54-dependent Fis family transcriptional regulator [Candidatus Cloacimonetes bacterium]|nr:sigma-54-dependent Fis family transcriptional regulator [Candidatus Cloacimonadota bacterium]